MSQLICVDLLSHGNPVTTIPSAGAFSATDVPRFNNRHVVNLFCYSVSVIHVVNQLKLLSLHYACRINKNVFKTESKEVLMGIFKQPHT